MDTTRLALVTAGMGRLGTAICRRLQREGMTVAATCAPTADATENWLDAQRADGFTFEAYPLDVSDFAACQALAAQLLDRHGRIDVLVNHGTMNRDCGLGQMAREDWSQLVRGNLDGAFNMSKQVLAPMLAAGWGRIVNVATVTEQAGGTGPVNHAAAKAGMHGFTKALALELARHAITVNTVSPGYLDTSAQAGASALESGVLAQIPVGRLGAPDEVAALVAYLVSDAAAFVTGANLAINGGQHMA